MYIQIMVDGKAVANVPVDESIFEDWMDEEDQRETAEDWFWENMVEINAVSADIDEMPDHKEIDDAVAKLNMWANK